jgi:cell division transport system permease protein
VIRYALEEGVVLLRRRALVSLVFVISLAIPLALAGFTATLALWAQPLLERRDEAVVVRVLLHPQMDGDQRSAWRAAQESSHPEWRLREVPRGELVDRLTVWFPYLTDILQGELAIDLPPLVEITAPDPDAVATLVRGPAVIAVGPTSSVQRALGGAARDLAWFFALLSAGLLASAVLLAATWIHLEIYRHADEITIMRLVGATEGSLRGPFFVIAALPGLTAGAIAAVGSILMTAVFGQAVSVLGLTAPDVPAWITAAVAGTGFILPTAAAAVTLARHTDVTPES